MAKSKEEDAIVIATKVPKSHRILTFDLLRGLFLLIIMIDHIELYPSGWDFLTGKGRLWVSAAEGFFFISGLLIGMMYKRRLPLGMKFIFKKMWTRAAELYLVGVGLTFLFLAWATLSNHTGLKDYPANFSWAHYSVQALLMRFTYGWADFLVRFAILMFIAPFVFWLVSKNKWWLALIGIFTAWALRGQGFTLAWQLIFNLGIIIGFYWQPLTIRFNSLSTKSRSYIKRGMASLALLTFIASYSSVYVLNLMNWLWGRGSLVSWQATATDTWNRLNYDTWVYAQKWTMGPVRVVLFFIWFPVLYWILRRYESKINRLTGGIIELLGRNGLFAYTVHAFIVFVFKLYLIPPKTGFFENFIFTTTAMILLVVITKAYVKIKPSLKNFSQNLLWYSRPKRTE